LAAFILNLLLIHPVGTDNNDEQTDSYQPANEKQSRELTQVAKVYACWSA
jgi:hypothetical protein